MLGLCFYNSVYITGVFLEEMFEVTSCYFPVDFTPVCFCITHTLTFTNFNKQKNISMDCVFLILVFTFNRNI